MTTTTEAIQAFLDNAPINFAKDLTDQYHIGMECQVMVDPAGGEPVFDGDKPIRNTWSCSPPDMPSYNFHHIRVPRDAMSNPYYNDATLKFPLSRHVQSIGMTGWNWKRKESMWVGYDFDSITGHAEGVGVSDAALDAVAEAAKNIPWVQVRRSTGGSGLHLYVFFDPENAPQTDNHDVHSAAARAVLGIMEREAGFDFRGNMDVLGGNMWVWSRKISEANKGLEILKDNTEYCPTLPSNWKDNLQVITGGNSKVKFKGVDDHDYDSFEAQASSRAKIEIDDTHKLIEERISELGYTIVWCPDHNCWQTHTHAFVELLENWPEDYAGIYSTLSQGNDRGEPNCFAFPMVKGGLRLTRFGRGAREADTWNQDGNDWTWTFFNRPPNLMEASAAYGGCEDPDGKGFVFSNLDDVQKVVEALGDQLSIDKEWMGVFGGDARNVTLRSNKSNQLVVEMDRNKEDKVPRGWIAKGRKFTKLIRNAQTQTPMVEGEEQNYDDRVRALVGESGNFSQWLCLNEEREWVGHNKDNTRSVLRIWAGEETEEVLGRLLIKNWKLVNVPFQPEYMGNRQWNRNAPQFAISAGESGEATHWDKILAHTASDLDAGVKANKWCKDNGINNGADYLRYWIAFMFRDPYCKLPYMFFFGPQNSGKSIIHEALSMLVTKGVVLADEALKSKSGFNGELAGAVLCVVEETNLSPSASGGRTAYDRMKLWVTGEELSIHAKYGQPYQLKNTTHWLQMANDKTYCPIFPGDTRVCMAYVPMIEGAEIPKPVLMQKLREEAPAFLRGLMDMKLPPAPGRLRLPIIDTESKKQAEEEVSSAVFKFIKQKCHNIDGCFTKLKDFYEAFKEHIGEEEAMDWTYNRVIDEFRKRDDVPFGRMGNNVTCLGNLSLKPLQESDDYKGVFIRHKSKLVKKGE